ncbi:ribonuclease D [Kaarinaea lacus]
MSNTSKDIFVNTRAGLEELCDRLRGQPVLALDTEFLREKTYYAQLCLLQVAAEGIIACVDPLAIEDLNPLLDIIYDTSVIKVMHSARQDMEIFFDLRGKLPRPLFDSQIAATLMGFGEQVGYANLVKGLLDIELDKMHTRTDWSQRPLDEAQLKYAADDVRYLFQIYEHQVRALQEKGRAEWLREDFEELTLTETYAPTDNNLWKRVKGKQRLKGVQLAILRDLAIWREQRAQKINRPRRWVLKDDVMVDIARFSPRDIDGLEKIRGLEAKTIQSQGSAILSLIQQARDSDKKTWPKLKDLKRLSPSQDALVDMLMAVLRLRGTEQEVSTSLLASRKDLESLVQGERDVPVLHGWRAELVGHELEKVLAGNRVLQVIDGKLVIKDK